MSPSANQAFSGTLHRPFENPARMIVSDRSNAWQDDAVQRLQELVALQRGWDGYHAPAVRFENAHFALGMLKAICPPDMPVPPQFVPGTRGDLQVEWHFPQGEIELHVMAPNCVKAWRRAPTAPDGEEIDLTTDFIVVWRWMKEMLGAQLGAQAAAA